MKRLCVFLLAFLIISLVLPLYQIPKVKAQESSSFFGNTETLFVNWTKFWKLFNAHSAWDLEYNEGSGWISIKEDLQIIKNYTFLGEPVNKTEASECKITLNFTASYNAAYRLTFGIDLDVKNYTHRSGAWNYTIAYKNYTVYFDWSDIKALPLDYVGHGVKPIGDEQWFWFRIRKDNVPQGYNVLIDPSFGYSDAQDGTEVFGPDIKAGTIFTLTEEGQITQISAKVGRWTITIPMKAIVYNVSAGEPSGLEITCEEQQIGAGAPAWYDWTGGQLPITLSAGAYWLGVIQEQESGTFMFAKDSEVGFDSGYIADEYTDGPSDPFGSENPLADRRFCIYANYTTAAGESYVADLSQSVSTSWSVLTEWDALADVSQSLTTSWNVLTEWDAILDVTQALTTSWNILANLNTFVDLSQAVSTTWNVLIGWNAILDFTQSLTTTWIVLTQSTFNIMASLSNTFSWLVDVVRSVGGVAYIVDLSQAISTTWAILTQTTFNINLAESLSTTWAVLTQTSFNINLAQSLATTWTVLIQSSFNIVTSLSNTFTWTVDIYHWVFSGFAYNVDLTLHVITSWIVDVAILPIEISVSTIGLAIVALSIALCALVFALKKGKDKYEEED